jgi:3-oxoadipate enol-lactonase
MQNKVDSSAMAYSDVGHGTPLLLIHGFPLNRRIWAPQISGLAGIARVITPDLRGHGGTPASGDMYSMDLLADDVNAFLDARGVDTPIDLCGHSMGGYIAFAFYRKYAHRLRSLILTATRSAPDTPEGKAGRDALVEQVRANGIEPVAAGMAGRLLSSQTLEHRPELVTEVQEIIMETSVDGTVAALRGMKSRPDSTSTLAQIELPTLVVHGQADQIIPLEEAKLMAEAISGSQFEVIPDAGHMPNLEQPERFNQILGNFIKGL